MDEERHFREETFHEATLAIAPYFPVACLSAAPLAASMLSVNCPWPPTLSQKEKKFSLLVD